MDIKRLTDDISVSGQIGPDEVEGLAAQGFTTLINNRPDGEMIGQPSDPSGIRQIRGQIRPAHHGLCVGRAVPDHP